MALVAKQRNNFTLKIKDPREHGENVVFIKGGSIVIGSKWVFFPDLRIDLQQVLNTYVSETSRRLFNNFNDFLYVLIALNDTGQLEVIPSIAYNRRSFGDVKVFPSLSGKLPLILVRLTQDGSSDLKAFKPLVPEDYELYKGYGNFTLYGPSGETGPKGLTGIQGITGIEGLRGFTGVEGVRGATGVLGLAMQGITGPNGPHGVSIPTIIIDDR